MRYVGPPKFLREDLTGRRFWLLTVVEVTDYECGRGQRIYICRCDCETDVLVAAKSLKSGNTRSCGCWAGWRGIETSERLSRDERGRYLAEASNPSPPLG